MNTIGVFPPDSVEVSNQFSKQSGKSLLDEHQVAKVAYQCTNKENILKSGENGVGEWSFHSRIIPEDVRILVNHPLSLLKKETGGGFFSAKKAVDNIDLGSFAKRKKFFTVVENRKSVEITPDNVYCMEFYDAYFDVSTISLKLPGVSVSGFRYWEV
jgi:hypothetical protein